ncbi:transposase family protein [[Leptolyngbya] sp. PCC 7376]|uniref:transposase family protein n=1 Tax=[Leptolyngbya] sp. PCC 7376 TaxID=111781 RepID=UPI001CEC1409|nr:transposase family protein [[Leptolyngbya] sp. PCC 7376]
MIRPIIPYPELTLTEAKAKQKPGRPSIVSLENQLLLTLEYLREYRTYFPIA